MHVSVKYEIMRVISYEISLQTETYMCMHIFVPELLLLAIKSFFKKGIPAQPKRISFRQQHRTLRLESVHVI